MTNMWFRFKAQTRKRQAITTWECNSDLEVYKLWQDKRETGWLTKLLTPHLFEGNIENGLWFGWDGSIGHRREGRAPSGGSILNGWSTVIVLIAIGRGRIRTRSGTVRSIRWAEGGGSLGYTVGIDGSGPVRSDPFRVSSEWGRRGRSLRRGRGHDSASSWCSDGTSSMNGRRRRKRSGRTMRWGGWSGLRWRIWKRIFVIISLTVVITTSQSLARLLQHWILDSPSAWRNPDSEGIYHKSSKPW